MAILKHIAVKNADYGEAQRYLIFKYDEKTGKPVLDENGRRPCGFLAGFKHHLTYRLLAFLKKSVMDMCCRSALYSMPIS